MIELNLLPDVKKEFIKAERTRNTVISISIIVTIVAGAITALLVSYVYAAQPLIISTQTSEIQKKEDALKAIPEIDKYLTVQNQLKNIQSLHDGLYVYSRAFTYLQDLNPAAPNSVALSSVLFNKAENTLEIEGVANNFQSLNVFQNTLRNAKLTYKVEGEESVSTINLFNTVSLTQAALTSVNNVSLASFKFQLVYPAEAFLNTSKDVKVVIDKVVTSDADQNAPKEVFGTQPSGGQ